MDLNYLLGDISLQWKTKEEEEDFRQKIISADWLHLGKVEICVNLIFRAKLFL